MASSWPCARHCIDHIETDNSQTTSHRKEQEILNDLQTYQRTLSIEPNMPETAGIGELHGQKLQTNDITGYPVELYKVLPDCVLDSEKTRKRLCEPSLQTKAEAQSTIVAAASGSASGDRDSPRVPRYLNVNNYVIMNTPLTKFASSSTSAAASPCYHIPEATASFDVSKLPPGVDEKALQKLFPLNPFSDELNPSAAAREEEDRPLAGLCAALLGRAVRDGLGKAYVHGVLAVAGTVAPAFQAATLVWRDPRSGLDLFDLALRHGHASTLLQLSSFSKEFRELICDKEKQLSHSEVLYKQDTASKLEEKSCKNDCGTSDSFQIPAHDSDTDEIKENECSSKDSNVLESSKHSGKARERCSKLWQNYDFIALHLISAEHQRCDINRNECPLLRPCSSRSFQEKNETANIQTSPSPTNKSFSDKCSKESECPQGDPRDKPFAAMKLSTRFTDGGQVWRSNLSLSPNRNKPSVDGDEISAETSEDEMNVSSKEYGAKQAIFESPIQVTKSDFVHQENRRDSVLDEERDISGRNNRNPYQETPAGYEWTRRSPTSSLKDVDALKQLPRPKGILKRERKRTLGPSRSVTFSKDTKSGPSDCREFEDGLHSYYTLRRSRARTISNERPASYSLDADHNAHTYVNVESRVTGSKGETSLDESLLTDSLEEQTGSMESEDLRTEAHVQGVGFVSSPSKAQPTFERLASSPKRGPNSYFKCDCTGCCWLKSMASSGPIVEKASSKPERCALTAFEVKSSSSGRLASLSSFLTRKAGRAKKFVKNARVLKYSKRHSTSTATSTPKGSDGLVANRLQDQTLDTGYVDNRENCMSFARIQQERKVDSQADGKISVCSRSRLLFRGQSRWRYEGCYEDIFSNTAFCDAPLPKENMKSGTRQQQVLADFHLNGCFHRDALMGNSMTRNQHGESSYFYESVDDTLMAVDEMIRESVNHLSLLNVPVPVFSASEVTISSQQWKVPTMETMDRNSVSTTSASPKNLKGGANTTCHLDAAHPSQQEAESTSCKSMKMPLASVPVDVQSDTKDASTEPGETPAGNSEDNVFHAACYFGPPKVKVHLVCHRDLDAVAGLSSLAEGSFKRGTPQACPGTPVGTPISLCEMGEYPELASSLRELRAAA